MTCILFKKSDLFLFFSVPVTDDRSGPQPIPSLLVGRDKDWISLSPYAIHLWEKLLLEPYSYSRDIAYIVVAPDNDFILHQVRHFFRELSSMYEVRLI